MPDRANTQETTTMALEILRRIPRSRMVTAKEIHEQLSAAGYDRDLRTIQRTMEMLSMNFDIIRDERSKPYGYRWSDKAIGISIPNLSEQESLILALAEEYLKNLLPAEVLQSMDGFFKQARYNLDYDNATSRESAWENKVKIVSTSQRLLPPKVEPGVYEAVSKGLYHNKWLNIEYQNAKDVMNNIEVMPLGLAQQGPRLYLVCRYKGFNNERSLALHRMKSASVSTIGFTPPHDFELQQYDDDGRFGFGYGDKVGITFKISNEAGYHLNETPLSEDQEITHHGDYYLVKATTIDSLHLKWWLRTFGDEVWDIEKD